MEKVTVHIVGAVNIDYIAVSDHFIEATSTPSQISKQLGGVGFNLFQGFDYTPKHFYTLTGEDELKDILNHHPQRNFIHSISIKGKKSGTYLALMEGGKLLYAAADTSLLEEREAQESLLRWSEQWHSGDWLLFDANWPPHIIKQINELAFQKKLTTIFETVSFTKAERSKDALSRLYLITPTEEELLALLSNSNNKNIGNNEDVINWLREKDIQHCIVTKGDQGVEWYAQEGWVEKLPPTQKLQVKSSNGAGDFFLTQVVKGAISFHPYFPSREQMRSVIVSAMRQTETFLLS